MLGIWNVGDVGYSGCWKLGGGGGGAILGIWNVWDVECLAYEMFWI